MGRRPFVKDKIEEAAFDLFARRGYEAVTTREIAQLAGVGHASMYRHYSSVEELGKIVYGQAMRPLIEELLVIEDSKLSRQEIIEKCVHLFCGWYDNHPRALALLIFPPHDFVPEELAEEYNNNPRNIIRRVLNCDEDTLAVIWGAITGPLQDRYLRRRSGKMQKYADKLATIICKLIK